MFASDHGPLCSGQHCLTPSDSRQLWMMPAFWNAFGWDFLIFSGHLKLFRITGNAWSSTGNAWYSTAKLSGTSQTQNITNLHAKTTQISKSAIVLAELELWCNLLQSGQPLCVDVLRPLATAQVALRAEELRYSLPLNGCIKATCLKHFWPNTTC